MVEHDWLAERFEEHRGHLRAVAYRMLGSRSEADDAVQEAWLRLSRADTSGVENLRGWLTTVVARLCLDMLRSRTARPEEPLEGSAHPPEPLASGDAGSDPEHDALLSAHPPEPLASGDAGSDPEHDALLADSVGLALLVVLETLAPAERVAFVLHDMFDLPFDEIAPIVGRSAAAARQLASRARRRVQGATTTRGADVARQRQLVDAFLAASRGGDFAALLADFAALLAVLDPEVVLRADPAAVQMGAAAEVRGAQAVADTFKGRARAAQPALVNGAVGLVWYTGGQPHVVFHASSTWWCSTNEVPVVGSRIGACAPAPLFPSSRRLGHACKLAPFGLVRADIGRRFDDNEQHEGGERRPESHGDPAAEQHGEVQDDHSAVGLRQEGVQGGAPVFSVLEVVPIEREPVAREQADDGPAQVIGVDGR